MSIDISALPSTEPELRELADAIRQAYAKAQRAQTTIEQGRAQWREATIDLAAALLKGRELCQNNDRAFGAWLNANPPLDKISPNDREALLAMARYPDETREALVKTQKTSWYTLWYSEIRPKVKTPPRISPRPSEDPAPAVIENDLPRETAVDQTADERGSAPPSPEVAKSGDSKGSSRPATRSAKSSSQRSSLALRPISVEKFCADALSVAKRLIARLENPSDDMIEGVKNCLAEIGALVERCQCNGGTLH
jgi:hypothetical protein